MTGQLHDKAWQQQDDAPWYDDDEGYPVQCAGCGAWCVIGVSPPEDWHCPSCEGEEAEYPM